MIYKVLYIVFLIALSLYTYNAFGVNFFAIFIICSLITILFNNKLSPNWYQKKIKYIVNPFLLSFCINVFFSLILNLFVDYDFKTMFLVFVLKLMFEIFLIYFFKTFFNKETKSAGINTYVQYALDINPNNDELIKNSEFISNLNEQNLNEIGQLTNNNYLIYHKPLINDWYIINQEFENLYKQLENGGFLIVKYRSREQDLQNKVFVFTLYKIGLHEFLAKIPHISNLFNFFTRGKNKLLSSIEVKGRSYYNGFKMIKEISNSSDNILVLQKDKTPSNNPNPSFFLFTKLNRVSLHGNIVKILKIRSMYPYSEFLQKEIYESNSLDNNGKFLNDPRITTFGKFIRKYWIDEVPQIFELLNGKIKLVGIRAMSQHFFSLYSEDYKELYYNTKPGIISPIFSDDSNFGEIEKIEKQYLLEYQKKPYITDFKYFWLTVKSIFNGVRSK
jgi:lipopolysaccharide/colanic/teichoic acid biosynthesis glycosyltransferase